MQHIIFLLVLIYASIRDIQYKRVDTHTHILLLLTGLLNASLFSVSGLIYSIVGYLVLFIPMFLLALKGGLGGGDVKLAGLCGFILGPFNGLLALIIGMTLGLIIQSVINKVKHNKEPFALVPYISLGCIIVVIVTAVAVIF